MLLDLARALVSLQITAEIGRSGEGKLYQARHINLRRGSATTTFAATPNKPAPSEAKTTVADSLANRSIGHSFGFYGSTPLVVKSSTQNLTSIEFSDSREARPYLTLRTRKTNS